MTTLGYFNKDAFHRMQHRVDRIHLPRELGAIPRKFGSSLSHMKADQVRFLIVIAVFFWC